MQAITLSHNVNQPSVGDYNSRYDRMPCNTSNKQAIFDVLTDPENIHRIIIVIQETNISPISIYERKLQEAINNGVINPVTNHEKQFVGTVTRSVMEANGFSKSERKQRFTKGLFKSGEIYMQNN